MKAMLSVPKLAGVKLVAEGLHTWQLHYAVSVWTLHEACYKDRRFLPGLRASNGQS